MALHKIPSLRRWANHLLRRVHLGDIRIRHHWTGSRFLLHSARHKGYWYFGKNREKATMLQFAKLIQKGQTVFDIGGHIGYLALYFSKLVRESGQVYTFEPGENNLSYIRENTAGHTNIHLVEEGVHAADGSLVIHLENQSGQVNSFDPEYLADYIASNDHFQLTHPQQRLVPVVSLDSFCYQHEIFPHFIKIDAEGSELAILNGAKRLLQEHRPSCMLELQWQTEKVFDLLTTLGYELYTPHKAPLTHSQFPLIDPNVYCIHPLNKQQRELFFNEPKIAA